MEGYSNSYQNGSVSKEAEFQRLAQSIGTNIQKMIQNGNTFQIYYHLKYHLILDIFSFQIYFYFKYQFISDIFLFQILIYFRYIFISNINLFEIYLFPILIGFNSANLSHYETPLSLSE